MICVPLIFVTLLTLVTNTPTIIPLPSWLTVPHLSLHLGTLGGIVYSGVYLLLEPVAGGLFLPLIFGWVAYSDHLLSTIPGPTNKIAGTICVLSWLAQFVGHGVFEGRAPALLDNAVQALIMAPFFVFMELLFKLGYRPELQRRVETQAQKKFEELEAKKAKKSIKNGNAS